MKEIKALFTVAISAFLYILSLPFSACAIYSNAGTDYWLMFPKNHLGASGQSLIIVSKVSTTGNVTIPGLYYSTDFTVAPGAATAVTLPAYAYNSSDDGIEQNSVHISSAGEIIVYGLSYGKYASDAFLALPVSALGTLYMVMTYRDGVDGPQFGVAAAFDNTSVTIIPDIATVSRNAYVPFTITLNQGDTYQLHNDRGDFTGTVISSDKPVTVIGGNRCAVVPATSASCNCLVEQLPPIEDWGEVFLSMPYASRSKGDTFMFLASSDDTVININGTDAAHIDSGKFYETMLTGPAQVVSTKPVLAAQFASSWPYDNVNFGDPSMTLVTPAEKFMDSYTLSTPMGWPAFNYLNITAERPVSVKIDGTCVPPSAFTQIGAGNYMGAQIAVQPGEHTVTGSLPIGVQVYGFDHFDAYSYPGGSAKCTPSITPTHTVSGTVTATLTETGTETLTCTFSPEFTATFTATNSHTYTLTLTATQTNSMTMTLTVSLTATRTVSLTATATFSATPTVTATQTCTITPECTAAVTKTSSKTSTITVTPSFTQSFTVTKTLTPTLTSTLTVSATLTVTKTPEPTLTPTMLPFCFELKGVFPNPSKTDVNIVYRLCRDSDIKAVIFSVSGEKVRVLEAQGRQGLNSLCWDAKNSSGQRAASGVFIYSMEASAQGGESRKLWGKAAVIK